jgi:uncharacterized membrane protein YphA (DoxX/SURF4 family)
MTRRFLTACYWIVAAEFMLGAVTKFWSGRGPLGQDYAIKFVDWGYPSWFRFVVGSLELISAALLVVPRKPAKFLGAACLVLVLTGAVTTHVVNHNSLSESIQAPIHLAIAGMIALANWPADWRYVLHPWRSGGAMRA